MCFHVTIWQQWGTKQNFKKKIFILLFDVIIVHHNKCQDMNEALSLLSISIYYIVIISLCTATPLQPTLPSTVTYLHWINHFQMF